MTALFRRAPKPNSVQLKLNIQHFNMDFLFTIYIFIIFDSRSQDVSTRRNLIKTKANKLP